ncbi:MAG: tail fiber domain-containing protein [Prolixibacteraceae bacterium]|nr:tail fiber domain-containing protein [Prolixibacteraceae bacterium]
MVLLLSMAVIPFGLRAQIVVDSNGKVAVRSASTATQDFYVNGSVKIKNDNGAYLILQGYYYDPIIYPGTGNSGSVGTSNKPFENVYSYNYPSLSDKRQKENIRQINNALETILNLEGVKYDIKKEYAYDETLIKDEEILLKKEEKRKDKVGFLAQDVQKVLPEVVVYDDTADVYAIDYSKVVPVLVEAIKELSAKVDELQNKSRLKSASLNTVNISEETKEALLEQNVPNPFSNATRIDMYLPKTISTAKLYLYTMQGEQIKSMEVTGRGNTSTTIEGYSLKAGMYLYTLIADGKEVDTKKMILTK